MGAAGAFLTGAFKVGSRIAGLGADLQAGARNARELQRAADLEEVNAATTLQDAGQAAGLARMKASLVAAKQRVGYSASGVDATVGTPAAAIGATGLAAEFAITQEKNNALRKAFNYKETARRYRGQADAIVEQLKAKQVETALGLAGDLVNMGGDVIKAGG